MLNTGKLGNAPENSRCIHSHCHATSDEAIQLISTIVFPTLGLIFILVIGTIKDCISHKVCSPYHQRT